MMPHTLQVPPQITAVIQGFDRSLKPLDEHDVKTALGQVRNQMSDPAV